MFEYDHRQIDLMELRNAGIRTFREVEEMIEGWSFADLIPGPGRFYEYTGFTRESKALKVLIKEGEDVRLETLDVSRPSVEEIIRDFCQYCR